MNWKKLKNKKVITAIVTAGLIILVNLDVISPELSNKINEAVSTLVGLFL
jgi:hypothetical protein